MKHTRKFTAVWVALLVAASFATAQAKAVHLFFIGNSFSGNARTYLPEIAKNGGDELVLGKAEIGSCPLEKHWAAVEAAEADPNDPKGKPYGGKSLRELLSQGKWDVVSIQQYSMHSGDVETYRPYAEKLVKFIRTLQPDAEIVLHQTWAYSVDAPSFGHIASGTNAASQKEMWEKSRAAYRTIGKELGLKVVPVGDAFYAVNTDPQWAYKKDPAFDFANPVAPALPDQKNSLHSGYAWEKEKGTFKFDSHHASSAGCYLAGLVWYGFLFDQSPEKITYTPEKVPAEFAAHLRQVATQTLKADGDLKKVP